MNILYFWEPNGGLSLADRTNPYGPLLAAALQKQGITLEFGQYAFEKPYLKERRKAGVALHRCWKSETAI